GSSPRARGTPRPPCVRSLAHRFIPAGAGNTTMPDTAIARATVHPRGRGEHNGLSSSAPTVYGSSPRARGTRRGTVRTPVGFRFIPAGAGNTPTHHRFRPSLPVHPRGRGEHQGGNRIEA